MVMVVGVLGLVRPVERVCLHSFEDTYANRL